MNKKVFYITLPALFVMILIATSVIYRVVNPKSSANLPADEYYTDEPEEYISPSPQPASTSSTKKTTKKTTGTSEERAPSDTSAPAETTSTIVVYGDSRTGHDIHQQIVNLIVGAAPVAVFHTGDLVDDGTIPGQWTTFNSITSTMQANSSFYPSLGNHEQNSQLYFDNFTLPGNERYYSVDKGGIHFVVLDSGIDLSVGSAQYNWLQNDLQGVSNEDFVAAVFHHPPYSTGSHAEDERGLRSSIVPLFVQEDVDIVFNGHDHNYERSLANNIYYIVTGGGGAPLYDQTRSSPYSQLFLKSYNYTTIYKSGKSLIFRAFNQAGTQIDAATVAS